MATKKFTRPHGKKMENVINLKESLKTNGFFQEDPFLKISGPKIISSIQKVAILNTSKQKDKSKNKLGRGLTKVETWLKSTEIKWIEYLPQARLNANPDPFLHKIQEPDSTFSRSCIPGRTCCRGLLSCRLKWARRTNTTSHEIVHLIFPDNTKSEIRIETYLLEIDLQLKGVDQILLVKWCRFTQSREVLPISKLEFLRMIYLHKLPIERRHRLQE